MFSNPKMWVFCIKIHSDQFIKERTQQNKNLLLLTLIKFKLHLFIFFYPIKILILQNQITMSNSQHIYNSTLFLFTICILVIPINGQCPATSLDTFILSGHIVAALQDGLVPLSENQDHLCYNYSLPYQLFRAPQIAISVQGFEVEPSQRLNFYIKPIRSQSYSSVSFLIRTQWLYTKWSQLTFNFIIEDRTDIQSGYYQIDTGPLAGCGTIKSTQILLPFRTVLNFKKNLKHSIFLHGFQITTIIQRLTETQKQKQKGIQGLNQKYYNSTRSPFQININNSFINRSGIVLTISVSTLTKVDSLYVGYVIMENGAFKYTLGTYVFQYSQSKVLAHQPTPVVTRNYARLYGLNGFLINYQNQRLSLDTKWNSFAFMFDFKKFQNSVQYFSFSYLFFLGSLCDQCPGYPYSNGDNCVTQCPPKTVLTIENFCIDCGFGRVWNGTLCVKQCPQSQYLNQITNQCQCPPTLYWNGEYCMVCTGGRTFNSNLKSCQCSNQMIWNSQACIKKPQCTNGRIYDIFTYSCICSELNYWNGTQCTPIPICRENQILNSLFLCVCKQGFQWNGQICNYSPCFSGQIWTGSECTCPIGLNFDGTKCIQCINGQKWNKVNKTCQCQGGFKWNGLFCQKSRICEGNRVWNQTYQQCICSVNTYWSGYRCIPVPKCSKTQYFDIILRRCVCMSGYNFDGFNCISCPNDKVWNFTILKCTCPLGATQTKNGCSFQQICPGSKVWIASTRSCQCPIFTVWNGHACISNPCSFGKRWNFQFRACQCLNNTVDINGTCLPPQIICTNGQVWNPIIYACQCPPNTFLNHARCDEIPKCYGGKVFNPLNGQCNCPLGLVQHFQKCVESQCGQGQFYNGLRCQVISCPPPSYFKNNRCIFGPMNQNCQFSHYWNGQRCVYYSKQCPIGTKWHQYRCIPSTKCQIGEFLRNGSCFPLPQRCLPPLTWNGKICKYGNSLCPNGSFWSMNRCIPYTQCNNGAIWDSTYMKCVCPQGTINNGLSCIECGKKKVWNPQTGCSCPQGSFDVGGDCQLIQFQSKCSLISNAIWQNKKCVCRPGFSKVNFQCICYGIQNKQLCDRCTHKPNSEWVSSSQICQCKKDYIQYQGFCIDSKLKGVKGSDQPSSCSVSTYFNRINRMCLQCPEGCLSCTDSYRCQICRPQFFYDSQIDRCLQLCGDGKKFTLQCDDGNNNDGDGCSRDCKVQKFFRCLSGSPNSKDSCYQIEPKQVKMELVGQIRLHSSITIQIKLDYIPEKMLKNSECLTNCQIFKITIISGDKSAVSINEKYIQGTNYIFAINFEFGKPYIGSFQAQISINRRQIPQYFGRVSTKSILVVPVNPAYLSIIQLPDKLT